MYGRHYTMPWTFEFKATDNADRFVEVLWADESGGPIPFTTWEIIDEAVSEWACSDADYAASHDTDAWEDGAKAGAATRDLVLISSHDEWPCRSCGDSVYALRFGLCRNCCEDHYGDGDRWAAYREEEIDA